ncbi:GNAT family N-acetyltransferase [Streptomyces sp. bgisy100]|uniref:GNAT family N-acetyltransferase n=1 Tax=Streptomyces sp. bgisy100 TaxID=3413783 RepID=UPI003D7244E7
MTGIDTTACTVRTARPEDAAAIEALDGSFTTGTVFEVTATDHGFTLREVPVDPPLTKVFPESEGPEDERPEDESSGAESSGAEGSRSDGGEDADARTFVAVGPDGGLVGFAAVSHSAWNRRLIVEDIEVAPGHRGRGIGRTLMGHAVDFARERGARHLWLEVTNVNAPAIHAYRRMGFTLCGLDTTLYDGTESAGEQALYLSLPCDRSPGL